MADFVTAYRRTDGVKVRVPAHYFDFPSLCRGLSKTPRQKADERKSKPTTAKTSDPTDSAPAKSTKTPAAGDQETE